MDNKKLEPELTYVKVDENILNAPNVKIRLLDDLQSREVGYEGLQFIDLKVRLPLTSTNLD